MAQGAHQRGRLGPDVKNFSSLLYTYKLRNQTKKVCNKAKELYCDATIFVFRFFILYLPKKMETEKWLKVSLPSLLPYFTISFNANVLYLKKHEKWDLIH